MENTASTASTGNTEGLEAVRERLERRFAPGWPAVVGVPDSWLPQLGRLDAELAALDPDYQLAQVKVKWGSLRFYLEDPVDLPCCVAWEREHALPDFEQDAAVAAWEAEEQEHERSVEHQQQVAASEERARRRDELIAAAEVDSVTW